MLFNRFRIKSLSVMAACFLASSLAHASVRLCIPEACAEESPLSLGQVSGGIGPAVSGREPLAVSPFALQLLPYQDQLGWHYGFVMGTNNLAALEMAYLGGWEPEEATMPNGWAFERLPGSSAIDVDLARWSRLDPLAPEGSIAASFVSTYAPTAVMSRMIELDGVARTGQIYVPLTPDALDAGYRPAVVAVPEAAGVLMTLSGLLVVGFAARRKALLRGPQPRGE